MALKEFCIDQKWWRSPGTSWEGGPHEVSKAPRSRGWKAVAFSEDQDTVLIHRGVDKEGCILAKYIPSMGSIVVEYHYSNHPAMVGEPFGSWHDHGRYSVVVAAPGWAIPFLKELERHIPGM